MGYPNEIRESIRYFKGIGVKNVVIVGVKGGVTDVYQPKEFNIPIILKRVFFTIKRRSFLLMNILVYPSYKMKEFYSVCYNGDMGNGNKKSSIYSKPLVAYGLKI